MATDLMKDWIVELHNPERKQVKGYLGRVDTNGVKSNCCLGVLCEVSGIEPEARVIGQFDADQGITTLHYDGNSGLPDSSVIDQVLDTHSNYSGTLDLYEEEAEDDDGYVYHRRVTADEANDLYNHNFKEIAEKLSERYLNAEEQFEVRKRIEDLGWA